MTIHLVRDYLRRCPWEFQFLGLFQASVWLVGSMRDPRVAMAFALALGTVLGPYLAFARMAPREALTLPVSRRELWLARWVAAVPLIAVWSAAAHLVGIVAAWLLVPDAASADVLLSTVLVVCYTGTVMAILPLLQRGARSARRRMVAQVAFGFGLASFVSAMVWPYFLWERLPVRWTDVSPAWAAALAIGAALTILSAGYSPRIVPHLDPRAAGRARASGRGRLPVAFDDRFTGLRKLLWTEWTRTLVTVALTLAFVPVIYTAIDFLFWESETLAEALRNTMEGSHVPLLGAVFATLNMRDRGTIGRNDLLRSLLRHLRALPLGPAAVAGLVLARRLVGWLNACILLGATQWLLGSWMGPMPWGILAVFVGTDLLAVALKIRLHWGDMQAWIVVASAVIAGLLILYEGLGASVETAQVAGVLFGLCAAGAAFLLQYQAITRDNRTYHTRILQAPSGLPTPE